MIVTIRASQYDVKVNLAKVKKWPLSGGLQRSRKKSEQRVSSRPTALFLGSIWFNTGHVLESNQHRNRA